MNNENNKKTIIKMKNWSGGKDSLVLTLHWEDNLEDWVRAFKTIMLFATWDMSTINKIFSDKYKE